jgi:hypothetical protein
MPPAGVTVAVPSHCELQLTFTCESVAEISGGCVIVNTEFTEHPAGLEIVHE